MRDHHAVIFEQLVRVLKELRVVDCANMFEETYRRDPVKLPLYIAVVEQFELDLVGDPCRLSAFVAELDLIRRQRDAEHFNPVHFVEVESKTAPAAANVQNSHAFGLARLQIELGGEVRFLVHLRLF